MSPAALILLETTRHDYACGASQSSRTDYQSEYSLRYQRLMGFNLSYFKHNNLFLLR